MLVKYNLVKYFKTFSPIAFFLIAFLAISLFLSPSVKAVSSSAPVCPDTIVHCWCSNGNQICNHQLSDCTVPTEIHNEMPGASACAAPPVTPTPSPSASAGLVVGVGGGPVTSASPNVVASQSNNQAGELPKTGLPIGALALVGLAPLGFKLKSFTSRFRGNSDASLIWTSKQLKK